MKVQLGSNVYSARLRFLQRFQTWMLAVGPVLISRTGLEAQGASLCPGNALEERQISEAGLASLLHADCLGVVDADRLAS